MNRALFYRSMQLMLFACTIACHTYAQGKGLDMLQNIDREVRQFMQEGDIPGLSLVVINGDRQHIKTYGYANKAEKIQVTPQTLFEIGSCTKAFTAFAFLKLADQGKVKLTDPVSKYLPWFRSRYKDSAVQTSILQLLHHTSGIPWQTIARIPASTAPDALEQTVRRINGIALNHLPGRQYEYATVNYDILALIIEKVTGRPFEVYMNELLKSDLHLYHTSMGKPTDSIHMSTGYKIGFFKARPYDAPVFKGNYAAGYIISNITDMAGWLKFQMGMTDTTWYHLARISHQRDETVALHEMSAYAMGWNISLSGNGEIYHGGLNPNYTAYIAFRPEQKCGIAILANSNSNYTAALGSRLMKRLEKEEIIKEEDPGDGGDGFFSTLSFALAFYILVVMLFLGWIVLDITRRKRTYEGFSLQKAKKIFVTILPVLPVLFGIYILPMAVAGFTWNSIAVWTPVSFSTAVIFLMAALAVSYLSYLAGQLFPEKSKFKKVAPGILIMSILAGLANMTIIILVTSALDTSMKLEFLVYYFILTLIVYLLARSFFQKNLVKFTRGLIYELRMQLIEKIFSTSFQKFEKMDRGRVYTALNDDVDTIGESANMFVMLVTSIITAIGAFIFLASIAFWATVLTLFLVIALCTLYYFVSKTTNIYFEEARNTRNIFMRQVNGLIDGFKEISLHRKKKLEYKDDVAGSADKYREKVSTADIRFVDTFLLSESLLIILLGSVAFAIPKLFPEVMSHSIMSFVAVLLYLGGSIAQIVNSVPAIMRLKIAWNRIQQFLKEIPANLDLKQPPQSIESKVENIRASGIRFRYKSRNEQEVFEIGPIDLEVNAGEILFIIGGNGSGKTTLAKILTGLYEADAGTIMINNKVVEGARLSEYFSAVYNPPFLFEKLYNIDIGSRTDQVMKYLAILNLEDKVEIEEGRYSTIDLSGGQRKRLALLQCYLEGSPIYLFDEWAADQDPGYRNFFYRKLLPEMKAAGKVIIAITHDDHYFDIADKILKMKDGKPEIYTSQYSLTDLGSFH